MSLVTPSISFATLKFDKQSRRAASQSHVCQYLCLVYLHHAADGFHLHGDEILDEQVDSIPGVELHLFVNNRKRSSRTAAFSSPARTEDTANRRIPRGRAQGACEPQWPR